MIYYANNPKSHMTQEIKDILNKPADQVTEDEKKKLEDAKLEYAREIADVCHKHGWQHIPFLDVSVNGIVPKLAVVPFTPPETKAND